MITIGYHHMRDRDQWNFHGGLCNTQNIPWDTTVVAVTQVEVGAAPVELVIGRLTWYEQMHKRNWRPCHCGQCWDNSWMIRFINVHENYKRMRIATTLYRYAQHHEPRIRHSNTRTYQGDMWARSTGDAVPPSPGRCGLPSGYAFFQHDIQAAWPPIRTVNQQQTGQR